VRDLSLKDIEINRLTDKVNELTLIVENRDLEIVRLNTRIVTLEQTIVDKDGLIA
jgi:hypothetical protein